MQESFYAVVAKVKRVVTDTVSLNVKAPDEFSAFEKAEDVLQRYPEEHGVNGVPFCYTSSRDYDYSEVISIGLEE